VTRCFVVDTYAWVEYFEGKKAFKDLILNSDLKTPAIVVAELSRIFSKRKVSVSESMMFLSFVSSRSAVLPLGYSGAVKGGEVGNRENLAFADGIIYSYATSESPVLTGDEHFRGKKNVHFVK
jgi:predicted nucleic acid-binding protein